MTQESTDTQGTSGGSLQDGLPAENGQSNGLNREAENLISGLPEAVRPLQLRENFPRICNQIAELWAIPELAIPFFDDLLIDNRGGRNGFSLSIITEVSNLREHFVATYAPHKLDVWNINRNLE